MQTVGDTMTSDVLTVHPDDPFKHIAVLMVEHGLHAVPVVDERARLLGVVSEADLTCHEESGLTLGTLLSDGRTALTRARKARARTARELMTSPARTIGPEAQVCEALTLMHRAHVGRLPVVDGGRLVGIVTRTDLLRVFTRSDDELQAEAATAVRTALAAGPADVDVCVADGIAHLRGHVERATQAAVAADAARGVPGIVDVEDHLVAEVDDLVVPDYVGV